MQDFQQLEVWRLAHALRLAVYRISARFPDSEARALTPQLHRSASSIAWNIAEGSARGSDADFARCLQIAMSSAAECLDQLIQARDLKYMPPDEFRQLAERADELGRKLNRLIGYLRRRRR
ncbi:MAG TPA: four helix bundle protein [Gemmatimonadaceae bacterium]|nr:four helix bundle protein [Gemmatimonadaceae bacterium]